MDIKYVQDELRIKKKDIFVHYGDNSKLFEIIGDKSFINYRETLHRMIHQNEY
jgi:hypothetical protein